MNFTQCRLRKGKTEQIAWIPSEFARKLRSLRINGENGWRVLGVGATMPASYLQRRDRPPRIAVASIRSEIVQRQGA